MAFETLRRRMSEIIEVIAMDAEVIIDGEIPARITAICLRDKNVSYECTWWDERTRKQEWLTASEIKPKDTAHTHRISMTKT